MEVPDQKGVTDAARHLARHDAPVFDAAALFAEHQSQVVRVGHKVQFGPQQLDQTLGSGFVIEGTDKSTNGSALIATDNHVISDGSLPIFVQTASGKLLDAQVVMRDAKNDLAILKVQDARSAPELLHGLTLVDAEHPVDPQEKVLKLSARMGTPEYNVGTMDSYFERRKADGLVLLTGEDGDRTVMLINGDGTGGDSGGPLLNAKGEVVAVGDASGPGVIAATPAHYLKTDMQKQKDDAAVAAKSSAAGDNGGAILRMSS